MDLIIGGAYQGKLDYAKFAFGIKEEDISVCTPKKEPDFTRRCLVHYEEYVRYCMENEKEICPSFREDAVIVAEDIFCGVVSTDEKIRAWREQTGRVLTALAFQADTVTRVFCGLPLQMKSKAKETGGK